MLITPPNCLYNKFVVFDRHFVLLYLSRFERQTLQREADQNQISLNVLVNQVLKRYSDWDRYENRIGMMPVPRAMLTSLIDMCPRQKGHPRGTVVLVVLQTDNYPLNFLFFTVFHFSCS